MVDISQKKFKDEQIDIINDQNEVVGSCSQAQIYFGKKSHRIVHAMIFNDEGKLLLQKRSKTKNYLPGYFVTSAGGHVLSGESPKQAIAREIKEELGVDIDVDLMSSFWYEVNDLKKNIFLFKGVSNGPFNINLSEVEQVDFLPLSEVREMVGKKDKIHNELAFIINNFYKE